MCCWTNCKKGLPKKLIKIGINDTYLHGASRDYLMNEYKINSNELILAVEKLVKYKLDLIMNDNINFRKKGFISEAQPEAL